jgi:4-amino-4-deoxy-L-arabinose transferase-like glycosyltransferase
VTPTILQPASRWRWGAPLLVFVAALVPRLIDLGRRPFWLDEVFTLQRASLPPAALVHDSLVNHHMPSFFLMLSPLTRLGDPQLWLRLPPAVFGALAVMLVYLIGSRVAGRMAGVLAALVLGLSPSALAFSQEARSYTMEMCLILVALWGLVGLAANPARAARPWRDAQGARGAWAALILGSIGAVDVLGDGIPWVLAENLCGAFLLWRAAERRSLLRNFLEADLLIIACSAPFYIAMALTQTQGVESSFAWIPPLDSSRLWYNIGSVYLMRIGDMVTFHFMEVKTPVALVWLITVSLLAAVATGLWRLRRRPGQLVVLALSCAFMPVVLGVISLWKPVLLPRYILWSAAPFAVLAGIGAAWALQALPGRWRPAAVGLAAALLLVNMAPYYGAETKPRWDIAAQLLAHDVAPGDVVMLDDLGALPLLNTYLPAGSRNVVLADSNGDLQHALAAQQQGKRVWAVYGHAGQSVGWKKDWPEFYAKMTKLGTPQQIQIAGNRIYITLFEPPNRQVSTISTCTAAITPSTPPPGNGCS